MSARLNVILLIVLLAVLLAVAVTGLLLYAFSSHDDSPKVRGVEVKIEGITAVEYCVGGGNAHKPLVILQHGLHGDRYAFSEFATMLASDGYFVVVPDAYGHGGRKGDPEATVPEVIVKTADGFDTIVRHYRSDSRVDAEHYAVVGLSLGGLAGFYHAVHGQTRPDVLCTICATPDWEDLMGTPTIQQTLRGGKTSAIADAQQQKAVDQYLKDHSPYQGMLSLSGVDLFMINGAKDDVVPIAGARKLYQAMCAAEAKAIAFQVNENLGHEATAENFTQVRDYLKTHLVVTNNR